MEDPDDIQTNTTPSFEDMHSQYGWSVVSPNSSPITSSHDDDNSDNSDELIPSATDISLQFTHQEIEGMLILFFILLYCIFILFY